MTIPATTQNTEAPGTTIVAATDPGAAQKSLGVDDFMKLLSAQLSAQDPLDPMKDTDFIAQMASFTSLQENQNLNTSFTSFASNQGLANASALIGKSVTLIDPKAGTVTGKVTGAALQSGAPMVVVGGSTYAASNITQITSAN
jgi:flagellar basal-body rod modification protein FlgD